MVAAPIGRGVESGRGCECGLEAAHEQIERFIGVGGDLLGEGIDVRGVRIFAEEKEQAVAQHCHGGHDIGVAAPCLIFLKTGVFTPVIADFDTAPMATNAFEPLLWAQ